MLARGQTSGTPTDTPEHVNNLRACLSLAIDPRDRAAIARLIAWYEREVRA